MKLTEYQAKELLTAAGVPVPPGRAVTDAAAVTAAVEAVGGAPVAVKAQVLLGGRGKAGGVQLAHTAQAAQEIAAELLGSTLRTRQGEETIRTLLIEKAAAIADELYIALLLDRATAATLLLASGQGGMDIEELAETNPGAILRTRIAEGDALTAEQLAALRAQLGVSEVVDAFVGRLVDVFRAQDLTLLEINPAAVLEDGRLIALDAKAITDDSARFRHDAWPAETAVADVEAEAQAAGLSWVELGGNVACLVNGAGLAMATADAIHFAGGKPANFLDIGGAADRDRLTTAFRLLVRNPSVKAVLVNVFGGIVRCDLVARALVDALRAQARPLPVAVRLEGTNIEAARAILAQAHDLLSTADTIDAAARLAVSLAEAS